ncbi:DUF2284 domain-containing protein [Methanofollis fontis]|uniref:Metal-binding protein n=1 Tax=Methanofollis fontis TaxID=2052832 RepID=A0A483CVR7_9EURY|nr:DUF2284 domain-containing protein [Methanofollis fontis]TAJ45611.1 metal-binding protein [Methanofollis fontis]
MPGDLDAEIERLIACVERRGAVAAPIRAEEIVVADWVRFKCRYGCKGYAKHLSCPPYSPTPEETRRMVANYETALLLRFDGDPAHPDLRPEDVPEDFHPFFHDLIVWVNGTVHALEKVAFYDGFYKAFGFGAYPCIYCETCIPEECGGTVDPSMKRFCRHADVMRPSMEAAGMDVFATARAAGWNFSPIPCENMVYGRILHGRITSIGLVLLE